MDEEKKTLTIIGKNNIDKLTKHKTKRIRRVAQKEIIGYEREKLIIKSIIDNTDDEYKNILLTNLQNKINSYKQQDIKRSLYNPDLLISLNETVLKLQTSNLLCHYCLKPVQLLYRIVREPSQWTLDRIDNNDCHSNDNTVIACLACNLKRRVTDKEKFEFTKRLVINKINNNDLSCEELISTNTNEINLSKTSLNKIS